MKSENAVGTMLKYSRRVALIGYASLGAVTLGCAAFAGTITNYFAETPKKGAISFLDAQKTFGGILDREIGLSSKDFGVKYSQADVSRIHARVWDQAQYALSEFYTAKERRSDIDSPLPAATSSATEENPILRGQKGVPAQSHPTGAR